MDDQTLHSIAHLQNLGDEVDDLANGSAFRIVEGSREWHNDITNVREGWILKGIYDRNAVVPWTLGRFRTVGD